MKYLITALQVTDYKTVHDVTITPAADAVWILLGGENANGKTSVLEAIEALLGGKDAIIEDPVRHGAERAELRVKLQPDDGPALSVRRRIDLDGSTTLEVRDDLGAVKAPQAELDKLIGQRFLDPLDFLRKKPPEQRAELLRIIDADGSIAKLDDRRRRLFDRRTEVGRDLRRATGAVESTPEVTPGDTISVIDLSDELQRIHAAVTAGQSAVHRHADAERNIVAATAAVATTELALERAQKSLELARDKAKAATQVAEATGAALPDRAALTMAAVRCTGIREEIQRAASHNEAIATQRAAQARRANLASERDAHQFEHDELDRQIAAIDASKKERLISAKLPIADLSFTDTGLTYKGALLTNASRAQGLCVAIAMAAAAQPQLRDVWIRDAAVLDDATMAQVAEFARANGIRPWLERVGTRDPGVIEIRDGRVAEPAQGRLL